MNIDLIARKNEIEALAEDNRKIIKMLCEIHDSDFFYLSANESLKSLIDLTNAFENKKERYENEN